MLFLKMKTKLSRTSLDLKSGLRVCQKSTTIANNSWTNFRISKQAAELDTNIQNFFNVSSSERPALGFGCCCDDLKGKEILDGEKIHFKKQPPYFIDPISTDTTDIRVVLPSMEACLSPASVSSQTHDGELLNVHTGGMGGGDVQWRVRPDCGDDSGVCSSGECHTPAVSDFSIPDIADVALDLSLFSEDVYAGGMLFGLDGDYLMTDLIDFKLSDIVMDQGHIGLPLPVSQEPARVRFDPGHGDCLDPCFLCEDLPDSPETASPASPDGFYYEMPTKSVTLVLDLDETLVHSSMVECEDADFSFTVECNMKEQKVYVKRRPYLREFLQRVAEIFQVTVFTASQSNYGEQLLDVLDPGRKLISRRAYRESCVFYDGSYTKDLTVLGLDLAKVAIVDNSPQVFRLQVNNGIPITSWFDDPSDCALIALLPFLERLAEADDVRPLIAEKFGNKF